MLFVHTAQRAHCNNIVSRQNNRINDIIIKKHYCVIKKRFQKRL